MPSHLEAVIMFKILDEQRSGPHKAHITFKDVKKLGQFIQ
jgi:hypothetical protein